MLGLKQYLNRRLTPWESAAVVVIVAALGGLGYATYLFIVARVFEAHVRAVVPRLAAGIRQQRAVIASAIEAYRASFGVYPPDHVVSRQPLVVDPVTNTLLYELVGTAYNSTNKMLSVGRLEPAEAAYVKGFFHIEGLRNCGERADEVRHFLPTTCRSNNSTTTRMCSFSARRCLTRSLTQTSTTALTPAPGTTFPRRPPIIPVTSIYGLK